MDNYSIVAPNLHFFAFQLCSYLEEKEEKDDLLWNHCDQIFNKLNILNNAKTSDTLKLTDHVNIQKTVSQNRSYLLKDENPVLPFEGKVLFNNSCLTINGLVSPIKLYDSYGLWLNIRRPEPYKNGETLENPDFFKSFNPYNCILIQKDDNYQDSFLGQTIVITAKLSEDVKTRIQDYNEKKKGEELKKIADECLKSLFYEDSANLNLFCNQEKLFKSHCFEYNSLNQEFNSLSVIVWLFEKDETDDSFKKSFLYLFETFFYKIKIIKAYNDGLTVTKQLNKLLQNINNNITYLAEFNEEINEISQLTSFQEKLKNLPQLGLVYSNSLSFLQECEHNIAINKHNYNEIIKNIYDKTLEQKEDLSFLISFSEKCLIFQKQLKSQLTSLRYGTDLIDRLINSIRGIVEVEKTKIEQKLEQTLQMQEILQKERENRLEQTIQIVGIGLATAGIASSSTPFLLPQKPLESPQNFVYSCIISLIIGIILTLVILVLLTIVRQIPLKHIKGKGNKGSKKRE